MRKAGGAGAQLVQTVKDSVQSGVDSVGSLVKKITPDALKSKPAKPTHPKRSTVY